MTKEREEKVFDEKMSGKGVQADLSRSRKNGQTRPLSNETSEQREERLAAQRKWATVKRSNETSEQREERLAAQRKRAAVKRCTESSKGREEHLRAERERAAAKRAHETSQEKELRLRARRERAALKRQSKSPLEGVEPNRRAQSRRDSDNSRRNHRDAIFAARRILAQPRMGWPWKSRFASRRVGSRRDGSLPSLRGKPAPLSLCRLQTSMATILSCPTRGLIYLLEVPARQEAVSVIFCRQRHGSW